MEAGLGFLILIIPFLIWIGFLLSLNKLVNIVRVESYPQTQISKIWVWTQVIPLWGFIALIVFNIKADAAVRSIENIYNMPFKSIGYPATIGWIVILGILYTWIPVVGALVLIICMIMFWLKVVSTSKQISEIKNSNNE